MMTVQQALQKGTNLLADFPTANLDAELLLAHQLDRSRTWLISHSHELLEPHVQQGYMQLLEARLRGKPIAYLLQMKAFYGRDFYVDERVLIPRPETEEMLEDAIRFLEQHPEETHLIDLGTGSGCLAISLAHHFPDRKVLGLEVSSQALEVAHENAQRYPSKNLELLESDLLSQLPTDWQEESLTVLANLPYIGREKNHFISEEAEAHEPHVALFGGHDGLELYRQTWKQMQEMGLKIRILYMEIGFSQVQDISTSAKEAFPTAELIVKEDLAGLPRTVIVSENPHLLCSE